MSQVVKVRLPVYWINSKKHNWFIPASGDVVRIAYYMRQYFTKDSEFEGADAFNLAISEKILNTDGFITSATSGHTILSSTEQGSGVATKYIGVNSNGVSSDNGLGKYTRNLWRTSKV